MSFAILNIGFQGDKVACQSNIHLFGFYIKGNEGQGDFAREEPGGHQ